MDTKSKILFTVFALLILGSVGVTYWKIMLKKDYVIENQIDCDPYSEKCFIWECDPESKEEGEACTGNPDDDIWYYKIARRNAANIPLCDPEKDENCEPFTCDPAVEKDCSETLCDDETKIKQGVECNDPVKYAEENPIEEEAVECEDGDEECLESEEEGGEEAASDGEECAQDDEECLNSEDESAEEGAGESGE